MHDKPKVVVDVSVLLSHHYGLNPTAKPVEMGPKLPNDRNSASRPGNIWSNSTTKYFRTDSEMLECARSIYH
jgi:hypothetical protein